MILEVNFSEVDHELPVDFGDVVVLGDSSYDIGFADGVTAGYAEGYDVGVEDGKKAEHDAFWDAYQQNGSRTNYQYAFASYWFLENFRPKYDIRPSVSGGDMNYAFSYFNFNREPIDLAQILEDCGVVLDLSQATNLIYTFQYAKVSRLPVLDIRNCTSFNNTLNRCEAVTIDKIIVKDDGSQNINGLFTWYQLLQNVVIEGKISKSFTMQWSANLTVESLQSFVDALVDLTGQTAQTWTLHNTVGNKLTEAQKATITAKNWTLVY